MDISIAICTYNRADLLQHTLNSLRQLNVSEQTCWEVLVINNRCTDHTEAVVQQHSNDLPIRHVREEEQGLSQARNRAIRESTGEVILFIDDDVLVDPEILNAYLEAACRWPSAGFFAGSVFPWYETEPKPALRKILDELANGAYLGVNQGDEERPFGPKDSFRGANLAFRRTAIEGVWFNVAFGRTDKDVVFGDELDFCNRLMKEGHSGVCVPSAKLTHHVPTSRVEGPYLRQFFNGLGLSSVRAGEIASGRKIFGIPLWVMQKSTHNLFKKWKAFVCLREDAYYLALTHQWFLEGVMKEIRKHPSAKQAANRNP